jgi:hypothetical protein
LTKISHTKKLKNVKKPFWSKIVWEVFVLTQIQQLKQQHSLAYWKQTILAQQNSGLTAAEYCRQQNIKYNAFYYWQRKIREDFAASALQMAPKDERVPEFATLATATVTATVQTATLPSMLKLSCDPVSLEVNEQTSSKLLARTLACIKDVFSVC